MFGLALLAVAASTAAAGPERRAVVFTRAVALPAEAIWIADVEGRRPRRLVAGWGGHVSPDGRWVAFQRCRPRRWNCAGTRPDLWLVRSTGGRPRLLSRWTELLEWAPDSRRLVAERGRLLVSIELDTADLTVLDRGSVSRVGFSPDGRSLVYSRSRPSECADLYVTDVAGGRRRRLTSDGRSEFPVWGRPGIAFSRMSRGCVASAIWRLEPDGSRPRPLLARVPRRYVRYTTNGLEPYAWFPDGRRLLTGIRTEWGDDAAVLDLRTGSIRELGPQVEALSRDGRFLLGIYASAEFPFSIEIVRIADGSRRRIAHGRVCCADWNR